MQDFFQRVYEIVAQIPQGKVATYGQIAAMLGDPRGARTVGWAMRSAPAHLKLPCHRVVNKNGFLAPDYAFGGTENQRSLLENEGVTFHGDGRIDMEQHLWRF
jgi:methylated-DNA-protein-cysteine methyltransferase-like protein